MMVVVIAIAAVLVVLVGVFLVLFNRLVRLRNKTDNAWDQIDVQLKRRYDLVPELAEVVKGYASHERETLESAALARSRAMSSASVGEQGPAEDGLTGAVGSPPAPAESYPDLGRLLSFGSLLAPKGYPSKRRPSFIIPALVRIDILCLSAEARMDV